MFVSARAKLTWAKKHIYELEGRFQAFVELSPYTVVLKSDPDGTTSVTLVLQEDVPLELGLLIGDIIHNLRCSLDHATWELVGLDKGTQDRYTKFPTGADRQSYVAACRGLKTPRDDTKQFFIDLEVFTRGKSASIYQMHLLDNVDKHMVLTPVVAAGRVTGARAVNEDGKTITSLDTMTLTTGNVGHQSFFRVASGIRIEFDNHTKVVPEIFFSEWEHRKGRLVIPTLMMLTEDVSVVLDSFEAFVAERPS